MPLGEGGLADGTRMRTYVDLSTTGAAVAVEVAAALAGRGIDVLDAPVSGGVAGRPGPHARGDGGGRRGASSSVSGRCCELFGKNVFHVGRKPGQGQTAKLLNNLLSATALAITSEAVTFGVTAGLDPATLLEVFNAGTGRNTATASKFPDHVLTGRFASGFRLELMAKDLELCLGEARRQAVPDAGRRARAAALDAGRLAGRRGRRSHGDHSLLRAAVGVEVVRARGAGNERLRDPRRSLRDAPHAAGASSSTATRATASPTPRSTWPTTSGCSAAVTTTILVDTGFDPEVGERRGRTCLVLPLEAVRGLGIEPEAVSTVVVTHFHYDHIGNLDAFPHAQLIVPQTELEFWTGPMAARFQFGSHVEQTGDRAHREGPPRGPRPNDPGTEEILEGVTAIEVGRAFAGTAADGGREPQAARSCSRPTQSTSTRSSSFSGPSQ